MIVRSLAFRLAITVGLCTLLLALISSWLLYQRSYGRSLEQSERSVRQLLATVHITAGIAAYVRNGAMAQQVVDGLVKNDVVLGARVSSADGNFSVSGGEIAAGSDAQLIREKLGAPFMPDDIVGELAVLPNRLLIETRASTAARTATIVLAGQTFVVAILVLIAVYLLLTRPLVRLSAVLHDIVPGERNRLPPQVSQRRDELGVLADDINGLLDTVGDMLVQERGLRARVETLERRYRGIFEGSSAGIFLLDPDLQVITANPAFFRILLGVPEGDESTPGESDVLDRSLVDPDGVRTLIEQAIHERRPVVADLPLKQRSARGAAWVHALFSPTVNDAGELKIEGVLYDVTQRKFTEEQTRLRAEQDHLTGLPNRHSAELHVELQLRAAGERGQGLAIALIDLDRFKHINDTHGHEAGDMVLVETARRIRAHVRDTDFVARLGGDEFLLVLPQSKTQEVLLRLGEEMVRELSRPIEVQPGVHDHVGASIGAACYPLHGLDAQSLRAHADEAMYAVKRAGRNGMAIYSADGNHIIRAGFISAA